MNRYETLKVELKKIATEKKAKKTAFLKAMKEYQDYVKTVYKPAREAALKVFGESKRVKKAAAPKAEKKTEVKKVADAPKAKAAAPAVPAKKVAPQRDAHGHFIKKA